MREDSDWDAEHATDGEFTDGQDLEFVDTKKEVAPKITDVPFVNKEIEAGPKAEDKAERYKKILLDLGFHKKPNGNDKEQYVIKEGDVVIGRTFSEKSPNGKFWALKNDKFIEPPEVKELKIVRAFYAIRDGVKTFEEVEKEIGIKKEKEIVPYGKGGAFQTGEEIVPTTAEAIVQQTPNAVINEAQGMATALYQVVEKQHLYMDIGGKKYLQLEAWQLLGKFCNVHGIVEKVRPVEYFGVQGFEARAAVIDSEGRKIAEAEAVCMVDEPNWKDKPLFQLKSMAQTRALSKAYRSSLSFVVSIAGYAPTPLEEMEGV